jgi:hypothetical protein
LLTGSLASLRRMPGGLLASLRGMPGGLQDILLTGSLTSLRRMPGDLLASLRGIRDARWLARHLTLAPSGIACVV